MHPNAALIDRFYAAFAARDAAGMAACYHPDVVFTDPAFGELRGAQARAMWAMLVERGKDLDVTWSDVHADDATGRAHWEARYTFSASGRRVHNRIDAEFAFRDGLIARHADRFGFWPWARQALGPAGLLLGWTPMLRNKVRATARAGLEKYMASKDR
ncbi:nuclear transport factor 2 family protein [Longimicrobium sp.]|uniref:nuclear transport factor 2 family protein n=1 Tax=Longimicrobium sp. TaxID=2029185 RepID=UPI002E3623DF|nr:nuclear transport factor 2 family protein [Longimicrobium sp.]HEX6038124.1 nuclear transport factor 2 family protein [Longimicrobium sp.]